MTMAGPPADPYLVEHVREALLRDPELSELHLDVSVAGENVYVTGAVPTAERRDAVARVVAAVAGDRTVLNDTTVEEVEPPAGPERLS
jgi:osmotically-inducible protein OsmY